MKATAGHPILGWSGLVTSRIKTALAVLAATVLFSMPGSAQATDGWLLFARVKFTKKLFKEQDEYYLIPLLDNKIRAFEGKEVLLRGHYIPMELGKGTIILSKFPYSMCFFCGGAGPESVAEVIFKDKAPRLKPDQIIKVKGTLKLNDTDVMHMNFILRDAQVEP